jgi:DNA-binding transcriptional ArsR family regulator
VGLPITGPELRRVAGRWRKIRASAYLEGVTLFVIEDPDQLLAVRFACSPVWETLAAVRTFIDDGTRAEHEPWHQLVQHRTAQVDLAPLFAVNPLRGYVPDFLTPPPRVPWPRLRDQLAEIRRTPPEQVAHELELCRRGVSNEGQQRRRIESLLADPAAALELLVTRLHEAWGTLVAPFWPRIRTLLARDIEERSRTLAGRGLRTALDELNPRIRWTRRGLSVANRDRDVVNIGDRGLVLMPSAYMWTHVATVVDEPWQPTIIYPARGVAELWQAPTVASDALARLLGRTRALVLASLEQPLSTSTLAALIELSPAGASRHLLALRDAGLITGARYGHEVRYEWTALGSALLTRCAS